MMHASMKLGRQKVIGVPPPRDGAASPAPSFSDSPRSSQGHTADEGEPQDAVELDTRGIQAATVADAHCEVVEKKWWQHHRSSTIINTCQQAAALPNSIAGAPPQTGNTLRPTMDVSCGDRAAATHHACEELAYACDRRIRSIPLQLRSPAEATSTTPTALDGLHDCAESFDSIHLSSAWPSLGAHCGVPPQRRLHTEQAAEPDTIAKLACPRDGLEQGDDVAVGRGLFSPLPVLPSSRPPSPASHNDASCISHSSPRNSVRSAAPPAALEARCSCFSASWSTVPPSPQTGTSCPVSAAGRDDVGDVGGNVWGVHDVSSLRTGAVGLAVAGVRACSTQTDKAIDMDGRSGDDQLFVLPSEPSGSFHAQVCGRAAGGFILARASCAGAARPGLSAVTEPSKPSSEACHGAVTHVKGAWGGCEAEQGSPQQLSGCTRSWQRVYPAETRPTLPRGRGREAAAVAMRASCPGLRTSRQVQSTALLAAAAELQMVDIDD